MAHSTTTVLRGPGLRLEGFSRKRLVSSYVTLTISRSAQKAAAATQLPSTDPSTRLVSSRAESRGEWPRKLHAT